MTTTDRMPGAPDFSAPRPTPRQQRQQPPRVVPIGTGEHPAPPPAPIARTEPTAETWLDAAARRAQRVQDAPDPIDQAQVDYRALQLDNLALLADLRQATVDRDALAKGLDDVTRQRNELRDDLIRTSRALGAITGGLTGAGETILRIIKEAQAAAGGLPNAEQTDA